MSEAIITRFSKQEDIFANPYGTLIVTAQDPTGKIIPNYRIRYKDGNYDWNYAITNSEGKVLIKCYYGTNTNVHISSYDEVNNCWILDSGDAFMNDISTPYLTKRNVTIKMNYNNGPYQGGSITSFTNSKNFRFLWTNGTFPIIVWGGGGGGGLGVVNTQITDGNGRYNYGDIGAGGGMGRVTFTNVKIAPNIIYTAACGNGGRGYNEPTYIRNNFLNFMSTSGLSVSTNRDNTTGYGNSGSTTYAFGVSAYGGNGGGRKINIKNFINARCGIGFYDNGKYYGTGHIMPLSTWHWYNSGTLSRTNAPDPNYTSNGVKFDIIYPNGYKWIFNIGEGGGCGTEGFPFNGIALNNIRPQNKYDYKPNVNFSFLSSSSKSISLYGTMISRGIAANFSSSVIEFVVGQSTSYTGFGGGGGFISYSKYSINNNISSTSSWRYGVFFGRCGHMGGFILLTPNNGNFTVTRNYS